MASASSSSPALVLVIAAAVVALTVVFGKTEAASVQCQADIGTVPNNDRVDCMPHSLVSQSECENRGCCWDIQEVDGDCEPHTEMGTPWCFFPQGYGYNMSNVEVNSNGFTGVLHKTAPPSPYGGDIATLDLQVEFETENRVHLKITAQGQQRYEVPINMPVHETAKPSSSTNNQYEVKYTTSPFAIAIIRKSTGKTVWNSTLPGFTFADQFIQFSSYLPSSNIYGLGEHVAPLLLPTNWQEIEMFARDQGTPTGLTNLYGVHPVYLNLEDDGNAFGVFLKNSNAMEVVLQPAPAITFRAIGGVIDMYVMLGPSPEEVIQQYHTVIGRPAMVPYWSLGFHLCRWGYDSLNRTMEVNAAVRAYDIPFDTQWNDIDYMDKYLDFTFDPIKYQGLPEFVDKLHNELNMHYVMITDPGISNKQPAGTYPPYDDGMTTGIFINASGTQDPWVGSVWPGDTVFPDFLNDKAASYWYNQIATFHKEVEFDGLWIDMNEPSTATVTPCGKDKYTNPPFQPAVAELSLDFATMCMNAETALGPHYNVHSLYGYSEAVATMAALKQVRQRRTIVVSRSTYPNSGFHGSHWLGDNTSLWPDLYLSIPGLLAMNMFGVPLVGADICGFNGKTTPELCLRWMQLGAFYPFSRNHNSVGMPPQDPSAFGPVFAGRVKSVLETRYTLLPYLYSLFHSVHALGGTVARPLFFEFPNDLETAAIDTQFLWGDALLITPVLQQGATSVTGYFPAARWFDYYTGAQVPGTGPSKGINVTLQAPMDTINLHLREGSVLPTQQPAVTTVEARTQPFGLLAALDSQGSADGFMFTDDGDMLGSLEKGVFLFVQFNATATMSTGSGNTAATYTGGQLAGTPAHVGYKPPSGATLGSVRILGVPLASVGSVTVAGASSAPPFTFNATTQVLTVSGLAAPLYEAFSITWSS